MFTGTHINYYFTCKRKLWLFHRSIQCEQESDLVKIGKIYHEDFEEIIIDNIKIDMMKKGKIWEVKGLGWGSPFGLLRKSFEI